jgi:hypothetical protein
MAINGKYFLTAITTLSLYIAVPVCVFGESLYSQINRNVIRLEHIEQIIPEGSNNIITKNIPDGTAFFVGRIGTDNALFVVTARHVAELPHDLHARVQTNNRITWKNENILLRLKRNKWIYHPSYGDNYTRPVDVAVMRIPFPKDRDLIEFLYNISDNNASNLSMVDPEPPQAILVFGFPADIGFELKEQRPIGRFGIISMVAGDKFLKIDGGKYADPKTFIVDSNIFPGNSGSPVINQLLPISFINQKIQLYGLVSASNVNMKFAIVEPVSRIRETIDKAINQSLDQDVWFSID